MEKTPPKQPALGPDVTDAVSDAATTDAATADAATGDDARALLGKLHKLPAPVDLSSRVPDLINRRSRGRFFGRKRLSERVPLEWLSLVMLVLVALLYAGMKLAPSLFGASP